MATDQVPSPGEQPAPDGAAAPDDDPGDPSAVAASGAASNGSPTPSRRRGALAAAALVVLVLAVYLPSVLAPYPFIVEEELVYEKNPYLGEISFANWWDLVRQPQYVDYTPVGWTLNYISVALVGRDNVAGIRLFSVLLHLGIVLMLWRVVAALAPGRSWLAFMVAAIYSVHPMCVEQVCWVPAQKWLLSVLLSLVAIRIWWHARGGTPAPASTPPPPDHAGTSSRLRPGLVALALLVFVLALFSKGSAVIVPVLLVLADWTVGRQRLWRAVWRVAPFLVIAIGFGVFAMSLFVTAPTVEFVGGSRVASVASHLPALTRTTGHWLLPVTLDGAGLRSSLSFYYHVDVVHDGASWAWALASGVFGLSIIAGLWWAAGRTRLATLAALWFLACQALVLGVFAHQWFRMADRYSCLAGGGFVLLVGLAVSRGLDLLAKRREVSQDPAAAGGSGAPPPKPRHEIVVVPLLALAILVGGNAMAQWMWQSPLNFHWQNLTNEPEGPIGLQNVLLGVNEQFYGDVLRMPLDRPLTHVRVQDAVYSVEMPDPELNLAVPVPMALSVILAEPRVEDLLYFEGYAHALLHAALIESRRSQTNAHPADGPYGRRLIEFAERRTDRPRVAITVALYQACRGRMDLVDRWLGPWRDDPQMAWNRLKGAASGETAPDDPADGDWANWFMRRGDYVPLSSIKAYYGVFANLSARVALARGDRQAAVQAIRVALLLQPRSPLYQKWLQAVQASETGG